MQLRQTDEFNTFLNSPTVFEKSWANDFKMLLINMDMRQG